MFKQLLRLANLLDKEGFQLVADEVDALVKSAIPRSDEEIDKDVERYFADPEIQERNAIEAKYLNEEQMLERTPFLGYKYNYEGYPDWFAEDAKPVERYHTVITSEQTIPMDHVFQDDGTWELMARQGNGDGMTQAVYHFKSLKDSEREKERAPFRAEIEKMLAEPDDTEVTEMPEDTLEVAEEAPKKEHGGGVKLF